MSVRSVPTAFACLFALALAARADAQDQAAAEALFNKGLSEMDAQKWDIACPAIAESLRLDPRPGTLFTLAECEAKAGKIASAVARYEDYLRLFAKMTAEQRRNQRGRDKVATAASKELSPKVPTLTLRLPSDAPTDVRVERDGVELGRAALGVALPTDPGEHVIVVRSKSGSGKTQRVTLAVGETRELTLELPAGPARDATRATLEKPQPKSPAPPAAPASNTWAWVSGGIGLAGIAVGGVTGGMVLGKKGTIDAHCDGTVCDRRGKDAADSAKSLALVSSIGFGVGIAGLATATVLLITDSSGEGRTRRSAPVVAAAPGSAVVGWSGTW